MKSRKGISVWGVLVCVMMTATVWSARAHTLPISYLTAVRDETHLHVELTINPFELNFFSELDANKNGFLESTELHAASDKLSGRILQQLKFSADGNVLAVENAGVFGEPGGHHLTFRAHYPLQKSDAILSLDSDLARITSESHLTEVTFGKESERQLARLDSQKRHATFGPETTKPEATTPTRLDPARAGFLILMPLAMLPLIGALIFLLKFARKHLRDEPAQPS